MKKLTLIFAAFLALGSLTAKAQMRSGVCSSDLSIASPTMQNR